MSLSSTFDLLVLPFVQVLPLGLQFLSDEAVADWLSTAAHIDSVLGGVVDLIHREESPHRIVTQSVGVVALLLSFQHVLPVEPLLRVNVWSRGETVPDRRAQIGDRGRECLDLLALLRDPVVALRSRLLRGFAAVLGTPSTSTRVHARFLGTDRQCSESA